MSRPPLEVADNSFAVLDRYFLNTVASGSAGNTRKCC